MGKPKPKARGVLQAVSIILVLAAIVVLVIVRFSGEGGGSLLSVIPGHTNSERPAAMKKSDGARFVEEKRTIDVTPVREGLNDMGVLITEEYYFTDVIDYSESLTLFSSFTIPFTETSYVASYDGVVNAGIDFADIIVLWLDDSSTLQVLLPKASIRNVDIDPESFLLRSSKNGIGTKITVEDFNDSLVELERTARQNALDKGVLERADENAARLIENFIRSVMGDAEYTLEMKQM